MELGANVKSGAFSVLNSGSDKLDVQISVMEWTQDDSGRDVYGETRDVVFFPKIMTVAPNEQRAIRIGLKGPTSLREKTYRLFIEEIPTKKKPQDLAVAEKITARLTIAVRYAIPIFVRPARPQESGVLEKVEMAAGRIRAAVKNTGNVRIKLQSVVFRGKDAAGRELFSQEVAGWYVLHGMSRPYEATVPPDLCQNLAHIEIEAEAENFTMNGTVPVQKEMCQPLRKDN